jgi:hypothetical protein
VLGCGGLDDGELGAVDSQAVLDVFDAEIEVYGAAPVAISSVSLQAVFVRLQLNDGTCQIHAGYPGIQHSGNATIFAPASDASLMMSQVFLTALARSSHAGSC